MDEQHRKEQLSQLIREYHRQGQSPATSTNYSLRNFQGEILISRSGVDKSEFQPDHFIKVDRYGVPFPEFSRSKPSAETPIHCFLYRTFPEIKTILHSHSLATTLLSGWYASQQKITFADYEILKGIRGQTTHRTQLDLPIFANHQDMGELCDRLQDRQGSLQNFGFLIDRHGLYAWGHDLAEAKRHLEVWEFLLKCELELLKLKH